jgi:hypothetical protein
VEKWIAIGVVVLVLLAGGGCRKSNMEILVQRSEPQSGAAVSPEERARQVGGWGHTENPEARASIITAEAIDRQTVQLKRIADALEKKGTGE